MYFITLDTGTTNTRVTLWNKNKEKIDMVFYEVGVRDTAIDGNNDKLKETIREGISEILQRNNISLDNIETILASGMITSNVGIVEVPHIYAPAGIDELANGLVSYYFPDIVKKEIFFIPGIKNNIREVTLENCESMDIMRGEETETIGLLKRLKVEGPAIIILPGSHSKFVSVDEEGKITGCLTSLAGELISVITHNTILASSLNYSFANDINEKMVIEGYKISKKVGLNRSFFSVRILDQFTDYCINDKANFLLGVILASDLQAIKNSSALKVSRDSNVIIGGKDILRDCFQVIIKEDAYFNNIRVVSSKDMEGLSGFGAFCIAQKRNH